MTVFEIQTRDKRNHRPPPFHPSFRYGGPSPESLLTGWSLVPVSSKNRNDCVTMSIDLVKVKGIMF